MHSRLRIKFLLSLIVSGVTVLCVLESGKFLGFEKDHHSNQGNHGDRDIHHFSSHSPHGGGGGGGRGGGGEGGRGGGGEDVVPNGHTKEEDKPGHQDSTGDRRVGHLGANRDLNPQPEVAYTVTYRREERAKNHSGLFARDSRGECRGIDSCKWRRMPGATAELVASAPELFEKIPVDFLSNFKNPCWVRGETELNCLPYFYVIGTYKCGTTDLWDKIMAHPDVIRVPKEPHWWGPRRNGYTDLPIHRQEVLRAREITGGKDDSSLEWYLNFYKASAVRDIINHTTVTKEGVSYHPKIFGDASISTAASIGESWMRAFPTAEEPPYTNADLLRALQPGAKIVFMVRNPTKRADSWFWYLHYGDYGKPDIWHRKVTNFITCFKKCINEHNLRYCAYSPHCAGGLIPYLEAGIYHIFLRDWIKAFSRDHVHVIRLEDWKTNRVEVFRDLLRFLDLRQLSVQEEQGIFQRIINSNRAHHEATWPQTLRALNDFYRPFSHQLAGLLGDERFNYSDYIGGTNKP